MTIPGIPESMAAAQVVEFGKPHKIRAVPTPRELGPFDLLLKTAVASLCHTDMMVCDGIMGSKLPIIGSHEGAGIVAAVGSQVTDFKVGDRVMAGIPFQRCQKCADCQGPEDYRQYCANLKGHVGVTLDGALADYMVADARESCLIPDAVSFETAAPLACAGSTIYRALLKTSLNAGDTIGLVGAGGGLGHLGCRFAKAMGLRVIGVDARDEALQLAKDCGADVVVDARGGKSSVVEEVQKVTEGKGVDASVTISDHGDAASIACGITKLHGTMVQVAQPEKVSIPFHELIFRDIRIIGSLICTRRQAQDMLRLVAEHKVSVRMDPFRGLDQLPKIIEKMESGTLVGKGIIILDADEQQRVKAGRGSTC